MIREALDQWDFVVAAYAVGVIGILVTIGWSWLAMRRAERRRDRIRRQGRGQ
jgi:nitrate reductase gamma subunit